VRRHASKVAEATKEAERLQARINAVQREIDEAELH